MLKGNNKNIFKLNSNSVTNENENIISNLKTEIDSYKKILKSYEAQNLKLSENERKIKNLLLNERKLFSKKENTYTDEIKSLKKKMRLYEQKLSLMFPEENNRFFNNNLNSYRSCDNENSSKKIIKTTNLNSEKKASMTHRTNYETKKYGNNSSINSSCYIEKIEKYLLKKFSKALLKNNKNNNLPMPAYVNDQSNDKINKNIENSTANKSVFNNDNNTIVNKKLNVNNDITNNNFGFIKKKKNNNRHNSVGNKTSKLLINKHSEILKKILLGGNNIFNYKKNSKRNFQGSIINNNTHSKKKKYKKLYGNFKHSNDKNNSGNYTSDINFNCNNIENNKIINNNINIYANTFRQDNNNNTYIKGSSNDKSSFHNSFRGNPGNSSAREYSHNKYKNILLNYGNNYNKSKMKETKINCS